MHERHENNLDPETNYSDLLDMTTNQMDWPSFASKIELFKRLHEDFENVNLIHIPQSMNGRADSLAR